MSTHAIVGAYHRPPAKAILQVLPAGCALRLIPEPENEYDVNAIKVEVLIALVPESEHQNLENLSAGYGITLAELLAQESWHLGYIPRVEALNLAPRLGGKELTGTLSFNAKGAPMVEIDEEKLIG
jgi:hypothetical protein